MPKKKRNKKDYPSIDLMKSCPKVLIKQFFPWEEFFKTSFFQDLKNNFKIGENQNLAVCSRNLAQYHSNRVRMKYLWYFFALNFFLPAILTQEEGGQSCRRSIRVALQTIFEEWEANNTICVSTSFFLLAFMLIQVQFQTVEDLKETLAPIFKEMLDERETLIVSRTLQYTQ